MTNNPHEKNIDEALHGTFPASDAPSWGGNKTHAERLARDAREAMSSAQRVLADLRTTSASVDTYVRENTWQVVAAATALAFVVGFSIMRPTVVAEA